MVPTGNFGDIFAGYVAKKMGLPIADLVIASNANDILPRTVETGAYQMRDVVATSSPSMDIQISSNFERYLFEASGRDPALIRGLMGSLKQNNGFDLGKLGVVLKHDFKAAAASEADVAAAINRVLHDSGYLLDPHTACAVVAAERVLANLNGTPKVILATAHPAKFPEAMKSIAGVHPALPARLENLMTDAERIDVLPADLKAIEAYVEGAARAVREA